MLARNWPRVANGQEEGVGCLASVNSHINLSGHMFTAQYRVYIKKTRFRAISMKTKDPFLRYPRKISFLKDLGNGVPARFRSSQAHGNKDESGILSKISLLNDLAGYFGSEEFLPQGRGLGWKSRSCQRSGCQRPGKIHCCYQTANVAVVMLAGLKREGQGKKQCRWGRDPRGISTGITRALYAYG
jgi:hypothetical protein